VYEISSVCFCSWYQCRSTISCSNSLLDIRCCEGEAAETSKINTCSCTLYHRRWLAECYCKLPVCYVVSMQSVISYVFFPENQSTVGTLLCITVTFHRDTGLMSTEKWGENYILVNHIICMCIVSCILSPPVRAVEIHDECRNK